MGQRNIKKTVSTLSVLQYPSFWQKRLQGLIYATLSGTLAVRILNRAVWMAQKVAYITFDVKEHLVSYFKKRLLKETVDDSIIADLVDWRDHEKCDIFITMPVRKLGNYHCYFDKYLNDLKRLTQNPLRVVTYVMIDQDDDLLYFLHLKKKFASSLRVRYFINPQREGYAGGHVLHSIMINENSNNYKIWVTGASDMQPAFQGWDDILIDAVSSVAHMCIIGGGPEHCAGAIHGPNPDGPRPTYWVGTDDFVFVSKPTMDSLIANTANIEGWFAVGDTWHIDGFFADLVRHMTERGFPQYFISTEPLFIERNPGGWRGVPHRESVREETLQAFFLPSHQKVHAKLADQLIKANTRNLST